VKGKIQRIRIGAAVLNPCEDCHECSMRCTDGITLTRQEFDQIVAYLHTVDFTKARRVLEQEKRVPWFEDIYRECCLFMDVVKQECLIYQARPLICRLFGRVEWLPCPLGRPVGQLHDGLGMINAYACEIRKTFPQWQMETGLYDLHALLKK
jgi:hypothetical protein